jgi:integrase
VLSRKPFGDLRNRDVRAVIEDIVDRGAPIGANRTLAAMRKLFAWACARDDLGLAENPALKVEKQAEVRRDRVLTHDEVRLFWKACGTLRQPFGPCFQLLLLLGQRREEVAALPRSEISADGATWVLPAARAKNKREHEIPLPQSARDIIEALPRVAGRAGLLFTTTGETPISGFSKSKIALDAAMLELKRKDIAAVGDDPTDARIEPFTLHDLRRTMGTIMVDELDIGPHIVEAILNHVSGHRAGVAGVYNHAKYRNQKRHALDAWAAHLKWIVDGKPIDDVVTPIRGNANAE